MPGVGQRSGAAPFARQIWQAFPDRKIARVRFAGYRPLAPSDSGDEVERSLPRSGP